MNIDVLPAAPSPGDSVDEFNTKAYAWVTSITPWTQQVNELADDLDDKHTDVMAAEVIATTKASEATASATTATTKATEAATSASSASSSAITATTKATEAATAASVAIGKAADASASAADAEIARQAASDIVYGEINMRPNKITQSVEIPDGFNSFFIDPTEIGPNVTITGLGNSTLRGI